MANYTKEELQTIEEMAMGASKDAVTKGDDAGFQKFGRLWSRTTAMIADADKPKQTRGPRKPKAEAPGAPAASPSEPPSDPHDKTNEPPAEPPTDRKRR